MAKPITEHLESEGRTTEAVATLRNAQLSANRRRKRPIPATRREADDLFRPSSRIADSLVSPPRLVRLVQLGLIPAYTNAEAHALILDAMYDEHGLLRVDPTIHTVQATPTP